MLLQSWQHSRQQWAPPLIWQQTVFALLSETSNRNSTLSNTSNLQHTAFVMLSGRRLLRLQDVFQAMPPSNATFRVRVARRVSSASDALHFLKTFERSDRWSKKYIVIDCNTQLAKDLIVGHVRDVQMGRRNYHYLLSGLVLDAQWEVEVQEYGAINITGFRIVDVSNPFVQNFLRRWRTLDPHMYSGVGNYISAEERSSQHVFTSIVLEALLLFTFNLGAISTSLVFEALPRPPNYGLRLIYCALASREYGTPSASA
ncbi:Receptor ligand binding region [Trinorchestia longiramus]|nr:Receptor ligand binding region [Trinorchestia longiramus]